MNLRGDSTPNDARVSVAIATYNRRAMAAQAIRSAIGQSLPPWEIVVADDASTDDTPEYLAARSREEAWKSVKILSFRKNARVGNWNRAINATQGEFVAWCSDDDRFLPGHLEASVCYLRAHPEVAVVHSGFIDVAEGTDGASYRTSEMTNDTIYDSAETFLEKDTASENLSLNAHPGVGELQPRPLRRSVPLIVNRHNLIGYMMRYYDWPFHPSTLVIRRDVWDQVGPFNTEYELGDTDWFVRAAHCGSIALLPSYGVLNRRHPGNWSNQMGSARMQREIFAIVAHAIRKHWPSAQPLDTLRRTLWTLIWSLNVRLRLALTIRGRLRTGHTAAALQSWQTLTQDVGRRFPDRLERVGAWFIRHWPGAGTSESMLRKTVSPL